MKKANLLFLVLGIFALLCCLVGCGDKTPTPSGNEVHKHSYSRTTIAATCTEEGYDTYECACGDTYNDNHVSPTGHTFIEGKENFYCEKCNASECDGFSFNEAKYNNDERCYVVTNASKKVLINGILEVPRKYKSLPVRGIMPYSFSDVAQEVKTLKIHSNIKNIFRNLWNGSSIWNSDPDSECTLERIIFDKTCSDMRIEADAFYNCTRLSQVNITKGMVAYIPADPVLSSKGGNAEYLFKGTPYFKNLSAESGLYYVADLLLHADPKAVLSNVNIKYGTVAINAAVFARIQSLTCVTIPKTVKSIGEQAFDNCTELETIYYNGTVEEFHSISIGASAFGRTKAKSIICTNGVVEKYYYNGYTYHVGG